MDHLKNILLVLSLNLIGNFILSGQEGTIVDSISERSNKDKSEKFKQINNGFEWSLNGGSGLTLGDFSGPENYASHGLSLKGDVDYYWGKIGLGINAGHFINPVNDRVTDRLEEFELPFTSFYEQNKWISQYAGLGPVLQVGEGRLRSILSLKGGFLGLETPEFTSSTTISNQNNELLNYPAEKYSSSFASAEAKLSYNFSKRWSIFVNACYITAFKEKEYTYSYRNLEIFGPPPYDEIDFLESQIVEETITIKPQIIHIGIGVAIKIGGKSTPDPEEDEEERDSIFTSFFTYYELKTREVGHFYKVQDKQLKFIVKNAYRTNQELEVTIKDFRGETVLDNVAPINMHESTDQQDVYESPTGTYRYMLPLQTTSLQQGEYYTMVVLGFKVPYYLRFKLE